MSERVKENALITNSMSNSCYVTVFVLIFEYLDKKWEAGTVDEI